MTWTDEKVKTLKKLWAEGKTASEISEAIGDKTRNAVIGKAHRLDLKSRPSPIKKKKSKKKKSAKKSSKKKDTKKKKKTSKSSKSTKAKTSTKKKKESTKKSAKKSKKSKKSKKTKKSDTKTKKAKKGDKESKKTDADYRIDSMLELKSTTCHWPFEDPKSEEFHFCGKPTWEGFPYCDKHAPMAYKNVKGPKKKKKKKA